MLDSALLIIIIVIVLYFFFIKREEENEKKDLIQILQEIRDKQDEDKEEEYVTPRFLIPFNRFYRWFYYPSYYYDYPYFEDPFYYNYFHSSSSTNAHIHRPNRPNRPSYKPKTSYSTFYKTNKWIPAKK